MYKSLVNHYYVLNTCSTEQSIEIICGINVLQLFKTFCYYIPYVSRYNAYLHWLRAWFRMFLQRMLNYEIMNYKHINKWMTVGRQPDSKTPSFPWTFTVFMVCKNECTGKVSCFLAQTLSCFRQIDKSLIYPYKLRQHLYHSKRNVIIFCGHLFTVML